MSLSVNQLNAYYGQTHVLRNVRLEVGTGEIVTLLGRNGSGRSSLARALMGLLPAQGSVKWKKQECLGKEPHEIARAGLGYVPQDRQVFDTLTVEQNLLLGLKHVEVPSHIGSFKPEDAYRMFAALRARRHTLAGLLSGGEQQMLSLCRTLMGAPQLLILDEPTEGLAPQLVEQVGQRLLTLKARGMSMLLMEQKLHIALQISDRCLVMGRGEIVFAGSPNQLMAQSELCREWLQV